MAKKNFDSKPEDGRIWEGPHREDWKTQRIIMTAEIEQAEIKGKQQRRTSVTKESKVPYDPRGKG